MNGAAIVPALREAGPDPVESRRTRLIEAARAAVAHFDQGPADFALADDVLEVSVRLPASGVELPELLRRNAGLGPARIVVAARENEPRLVIELADAGTRHARTHVAAALAHLGATVASLAHAVDAARAREESFVPNPVQPAVAGDRKASVLAAAASAGCEVHERENGTLALDLDVPGAFRQAEVDGAVTRIRVALEVPAEVCASRARAVAAFLLRATAQVRYVAASCTQAATLAGLALEVALAPELRLEDVERALGALTFAARRIAVTAEAIAADATLAIAYERMLPARTEATDADTASNRSNGSRHHSRIGTADRPSA